MGQGELPSSVGYFKPIGLVEIWPRNQNILNYKPPILIQWVREGNEATVYTPKLPPKILTSVFLERLAQVVDIAQPMWDNLGESGQQRQISLIRAGKLGEISVDLLTIALQKYIEDIFLHAENNRFIDNRFKVRDFELIFVQLSQRQ